MNENAELLVVAVLESAEFSVLLLPSAFVGLKEKSEPLGADLRPEEKLPAAFLSFEFAAESEVAVVLPKENPEALGAVMPLESPEAVVELPKTFGVVALPIFEIPVFELNEKLVGLLSSGWKPLRNPLF